MKPFWGVRLAGVLLAATPLAQAAEAGGGAEMAEAMPLASVRSIMLDITESSSRGIVVGERGHILVSETRTEWRQVDGVPTRATLTAVDAVGDKAWAVGHDGIILHSADGGLSWVVQREDRWTQEGFDADDWSPRLGAPLLDVQFIDENRGFAVGAYSLLLATEDGGKTWSERSLANKEESADAGADDPAAEGDEAWTFDADELELEEESDPHLNGLARSDDGLIILVAERGSAFRSRDDGASWERLTLPYDGSMFGVLWLGDRRFLAFGLRGNVLETRDGGDNWEVLDTGTELSLMGGAALPDAGVLLVGANGVLLYRPNGESPLDLRTFENAAGETPVLASALPRGVRTFLLAGERGMAQYEVSN